MDIKDPRTERLAAEVAAMTGETKTRAVRVALEERKQRLLLRSAPARHGANLRRFLEDDAWRQVPEDVWQTAQPQGARGDPGLRAFWRLIVDSSALIAVLLRQRQHEWLV